MTQKPQTHPLRDLLDQRRPHRADAARNFDAILDAARTEFTRNGTDTALDDIARRAGVGPATLYRNFATRGDLIEAVYVAEVDSLCQHAARLTATTDAWPALVDWVRHFITYMATKRLLLDALDRESGTFRACRDALYAHGEPLLTAAQATGETRSDLTIDDVLRFLVGVTGTPFSSDAQRALILDMTITALAATPHASQLPASRRPSKRR